MYIYSFWETEKRPGEGRKTSTQHEPEPRRRVGAQGLLAWSGVKHVGHPSSSLGQFWLCSQLCACMTPKRASSVALRKQDADPAPETAFALKLCILSGVVFSQPRETQRRFREAGYFQGPSEHMLPASRCAKEMSFLLFI